MSILEDWCQGPPHLPSALDGPAINGGKIASAGTMMRRHITFLLSISVIAAAQISTTRIKPPKKEKEPETQTLPLPPEPPAAVSAETGKLAFHVSPLSSKGLLTQQVRDALKALDRVNGGATFFPVARRDHDPGRRSAHGWRAGRDREHQRG